MKIRVEADYESLSYTAARILARELLTNDDPVLGLPTGETPKLTYGILVDYYEDGLLDFSGVETFNLDEYYPIKKDDPRSFHSYMEEHLTDRVNLSPERTHIPNGELPEKEIGGHCREYEREIDRAGGLDLVVLGIGKNGHIGFNEPGTRFDTGTRRVELRKKTIQQNFSNPEEAPGEALTVGIKTITRARKILLLASGMQKRKAIDKCIDGRISESCPASVLQLHPNTTVLLDDEAAANLNIESEGVRR